MTDKLGGELAIVLRRPETAARIESVGFEPMIGGPDVLAELLRNEIAHAAKVVGDAGIKPD